jgi:hypothetical protein
MEDAYKGHKIRASTWQLADSGHWEPRVFVSWNENQQEKTKSLVFTGGFSTEREAELERLQAGQEIDRRRQAGTTGRTHTTRRLAR